MFKLQEGYLSKFSIEKFQANSFSFTFGVVFFSFVVGGRLEYRSIKTRIKKKIPLRKQASFGSLKKTLGLQRHTRT